MNKVQWEVRKGRFMEIKEAVSPVPLLFTNISAGSRCINTLTWGYETAHIECTQAGIKMPAATIGRFPYRYVNKKSIANVQHYSDKATLFDINQENMLKPKFDTTLKDNFILME